MSTISAYTKVKVYETSGRCRAMAVSFEEDWCCLEKEKDRIPSTSRRPTDGS
jgi:hypothetical protein